MILGSHQSIAGGLHLAFQRAIDDGCLSLQVFTKSPTRWSAPPLAAEAVRLFREAKARHGFPVVAHGPYLINLAAPPGELRDRSLKALVDELDRCHLLGIPLLVVHPGSHGGEGEALGLRRVAEALRQALQSSPFPGQVAVENTAGQGTSLGRTFEHLAALAESLPAERLAFCFDTAHAFAAGYDLRTPEGVHGVLREFHRLVGVGRIGVFHLNDSAKALGSRVDRHEHIGQGLMGQEGLRALLADPRFHGLPGILETPGPSFADDIRRLKALLPQDDN